MSLFSVARFEPQTEVGGGGGGGGVKSINLFCFVIPGSNMLSTYLTKSTPLCVSSGNHSPCRLVRQLGPAQNDASGRMTTSCRQSLANDVGTLSFNAQTLQPW